jgi:hypothetical protein
MAWSIAAMGTLPKVTAEVAASTGGTPAGGEVAVVATVKSLIASALGGLPPPPNPGGIVRVFAKGSGTNYNIRIASQAL